MIVPHFSLLVELRRRPELRGKAVIIAGGSKLNDSVLDLSPEAEAEGLRKGMTVRYALARCRKLALLAADPVSYQDRFEDMLSALEQVSPVVEPEHLGCAFVGLTGLDGLYKTNAALVQSIQQHVQGALGAEPQIGIAEGKFPAKVAALHAQRGGMLVLHPAETRDFLAPLSVDHLPVSQEMLSRLRALGLFTLGQLVTLPLSALQAQFGREGYLAWHLADGIDSSRLLPRQHREPLVERLTFASPITSREALRVALSELVSRAYSRPKLGHAPVRQIQLRLFLEAGRSWERKYTPNEAIGTQEHLTFFLVSKLESLVLPGPVVELSLEIRASGGERGKQGKLLGDSTSLEDQVKEATRQLSARYGHWPVMKTVEVEPWSRIPERRRALIDYESSMNPKRS